jgi:hypothetical protein
MRLVSWNSANRPPQDQWRLQIAEQQLGWAELQDLCLRALKLVADSRARTKEMKEQLAIARQRLAHSRELLARTKPVWVLPCPGTAIPPATALEPQTGPDGTRRSFAAVAELIERVEDTATRDAELTGRLIEDIVSAIPVVAEPTLLMGILLEGLAETVLDRLSAEERRETAISLCTLLWDRIHQGMVE